MPLKDVQSTWLDDLDIDKSVYPSPHLSETPPPLSTTSNLPSSSAHTKYQIALASAYSSTSPVKLEPTQATLPPTTPRTHSPDADGEEVASLLLPPLTIYHSSNHPSPSPATSSSSSSPIPFSPQQTISPALLSFLPSPPHRRSLLDILHRVMLLRPSFNFAHFRGRVERLFDGENGASGPDGTTRSKAANARAIFFGPPSTSPSTSPKTSKSAISSAPPPTISFFAAAAAAFAVGTLLTGKRNGESVEADESLMVVDDEFGGRRRRGSNRPRPKSGSGKPSPAFLYALSVQALTVHEARAPFDLDYLIACLLQVLFLLQDRGRKARTKDRKLGVGATLFPLVCLPFSSARVFVFASLLTERNLLFVRTRNLNFRARSTCRLARW